MKINKSLNIDLNIISPQKHIRIHEGDVDSVDILIGVTVDDESVDLTGVTIKYDATINNYLAEQDADGSVVDDKISIPITQNMTAMSGLLLIDVRLIQNDQILFTQTICATVEKAVVNGSTYIDFDKITIIQRMNALEDKMDYIEELVENFDTSKLIVSANRPPKGAPVEVDVDLLRVGDTWILSGYNIVYKLVEARYNYSPAAGVEPRHYFTWQPLNERFGVGNTEPPTSVTYQPVVYTINEVQWSWLPVPEYFKGDHYLMQIGVDEPPTYYICKSGTMAATGVCTYIWREEGGSIDAYTKAETNALLADKMNLAPINPTAEEIAAMPSGQLYQDSVNHKGIIKGGQEFYDTNKLNVLFAKTYESLHQPPHFIYSDVPEYTGKLKVGDKWVVKDQDGRVIREYILDDIRYPTPNTNKRKIVLDWKYISIGLMNIYEDIREVKYDAYFPLYDFYGSMDIGIDRATQLAIPNAGQFYVLHSSYGKTLSMFYETNFIPSVNSYGVTTSVNYDINYIHCTDAFGVYTKTEIDNMIGDIETALSEV